MAYVCVTNDPYMYKSCIPELPIPPRPSSIRLPASLRTCSVPQIFMLFLIHAYSTRVWKQQEADNSSVSIAAIEHGFQSPEGHSKLVMDGSWTLLWPCFLMWPFFQAIITYAWVHNALGMYTYTHIMSVFWPSLGHEVVLCRDPPCMQHATCIRESFMHACVMHACLPVCQCYAVACSVEIVTVPNLHCTFT